VTNFQTTLAMIAIATSFVAGFSLGWIVRNRHK